MDRRALPRLRPELRRDDLDQAPELRVVQLQQELLRSDPERLRRAGERAVLGTHLYGTPVQLPYPLFDQGAGKERWMTEHYTDSTTDANSWPNAWAWRPSCTTRWSTANSTCTPGGTSSAATARSPPGTVSKRGWCMAQFSKFIRPGFYRVDATATPSVRRLSLGVQERHRRRRRHGQHERSTPSLNVSINGSSISSYDRFTTSGSKSLSNDGKVTASNGSLTLSLDAQSVTTLHGTGSSTTGTGGSRAPAVRRAVRRGDGHGRLHVHRGATGAGRRDGDRRRDRWWRATGGSGGHRVGRQRRARAARRVRAARQAPAARRAAGGLDGLRRLGRHGRFDRLWRQ